MNNKLLIAIATFTIITFGAVIYYGIAALAPRAYTPEEKKSPEQPETSTLSDQLPPPSGVSLLTLPAENTTTSPTPELATDEETAMYRKVSVVREMGSMPSPLNILDAQVSAYGKNTVIIAEKPSAAVPTSIWAFNTKTKTLTTIIDRKRGAMIAYSRNGNYLLTAHTNDNGRTLSLIFENVPKKEQRPLRFITLPSKCALHEDQPIVYCGIPQALPAGTILPDDYLKKKLYTDDRIVMVDFDNLKVQEIGKIGDDQIDVSYPLIIKNALFFTNRYDEKIYKLQYL